MREGGEGGRGERVREGGGGDGVAEREHPTISQEIIVQVERFEGGICHQAIADNTPLFR